MRNLLLLLGLILAVLALSACASCHPLAIPDPEWQALSSEQRLQAREKQAELDRAAAEQRAAEARAREAEAARTQADLEQRRQEARYGDRLQCVLSGAEARLNRKWRPVEPLALDLVRGQEIPFELHQSDGGLVRYRAAGYAWFDDQTLSLCRDSRERRPAPGSCLRLLGTFEDYRRGIEQAVAAPDFLRGHLRCTLAPGEGMPPRLIVER